MLAHKLADDETSLAVLCQHDNMKSYQPVLEYV